MTKKQDLDDIVEGCLKNDRQSQQVLFETFSPKMLAVCMRFASSKEEAEDMMIEGFVGVFKQLQNFKKESSLETWIHAIMVHSAIDFYRSQKKFRLHDELDAHEEAYDLPIHDDIVTKLQAQQILALMQQMPDELRIILSLHVIEGYALTEIAEQLDKNVNTVRVYFMRARRWLTDRIQDSK